MPSQVGMKRTERHEPVWVSPIGLTKAQCPESQGAFVDAGHYPGAWVHGGSCCQGG